MATLQIRLFGAPEITLDGEVAADLRSDKARALLAYLAVEPDQAHRREKLAGLLWPGYTESSARTNLRRALADLRQAIGDHRATPPYLLITQESIQFNTGSDASVDVTAFVRLTKAAIAPTPDKPPAHQDLVDSLEEAVGLYRAPFLEGFSLPDSPDFEEWALLTREQLSRQVIQALYRLAEAYQARGDTERALHHAWRQVEMDPWQESAHRQVMQLLAQRGQRGAAVAQFETCRRLLAAELGVEPSEQTVQLAEHLRKGEWPPAAPVEAKLLRALPRVVGVCPYRGLAAFQQEDAALFFGREAFAARLAEAVQEQTRVAVAGSSGSGKSSVVFAGLLPILLKDTSWLVAHCRPGARPFEALAAALLPALAPELSATDRLFETQRLAGAFLRQELSLDSVAEQILAQHPGASRLLLVVDQFEELYTLCPESEARRRYVEGLLGAAREDRPAALILLLTLRADFMGHALSNRSFADMLQHGLLLLGPMARTELRSAVERPAGLHGAAFEPGLVDRILDDVGGEPGALPLLEFALTLLWERHSFGWLTHAAYEEIGQVEGALARHADQVLEALDEADRERARQVFEQLVRPGEGTEDIRRLATRAEIGEANWALVRRLADKRLVVTGREDGTGVEMVELAHEALIQKWERLRDWMAADRAFRTWQEGLRVALRQWEGCRPGRGCALARRGAEPG